VLLVVIAYGWMGKGVACAKYCILALKLTSLLCLPPLELLGECR
jgi:hypothetical protein